MVIREEVQAALGTLPGAEKKIAHAFLANYPSIGLSTIAELAALAGTSAPTVLRFVARLGFESYPVADNPALKASFASIAANLEATLKAVPESEFEAACDLLSDHKSACHLLGGRFTDSIAAYMAAHLRIIRPNVRHFDGQTSTWRDQLLDVRPGDVAVLFDIRRYQSDLVRLGELLVERKARILLITDPWLSPIARSARVVLPCVVDANRTWDSSITLMAVAEALIDRVSRAQSEAARARMQALEDIHWNNLPGR